METPTTYASARAAGARAQRAARASRKPAHPTTAPIGTYQDSPQASKGNAFCWLTWEPRIEWIDRSQQLQAARTAAVDRDRAQGIDPLKIPGMQQLATMEPKRFAVYSRAGAAAAPAAKPPSKAALMRAALQLHGTRTTAQLAEAAQLTRSSLVRPLLANDIHHKRVRYEGGAYHWVPTATAPQRRAA